MTSTGEFFKDCTFAEAPPMDESSVRLIVREELAEGLNIATEAVLRLEAMKIAAGLPLGQNLIAQADAIYRFLKGA